MALVKGICKNFSECDLADEKVVQEVDKTNFICEECGKPLYPVDGGGGGSHGPGGDPPKPIWKLIGISVAILVVLAGLGYGVYSFTGDSTQKTPKVQNDTDQNDTILAESITLESSAITLKEGEDAKLVYSIIPDSCNEKIDIVSSNPEIASVENGVIKGIKAGSAQIVIKASKSGTSATVDVTVNKGGTNPPPPPPLPNVPWGKYEGPANGLGGTITVTKSYSLDLHDDGEPLQLSPGDEIQQTKFTNGELRAGVWVHNGSRRSFTR
jgi:hypothetical protein